MRYPQELPIGEPGPFTADQVREGSRYELEDGHPMYCNPSGGSHGSATSRGALVIGTDPLVSEVGVDVGYTAAPKKLRAPDLAVGNVPDAPGWVAGTPGLAVEYADRGQDEGELQDRIREYLAAGTRWVWVVRLHGPRRVEVHDQAGKIFLRTVGESLLAPGVLQRPVTVDSLYNAEAAHEAALSNLLQRAGYASLEAVRDEGKSEGKAEGKAEGVSAGSVVEARVLLLRLITGRGFVLSADQRSRLDGCADLATVERWFDDAMVAVKAVELID